jgi:Membrane protease subunits, stomatin/prohibitin homologs
MKTFRYVVASHSEFIIHQRFGKTRHQGRGISFLCLPLVDRYYRIPCTTQALAFKADQVTSENQGVEVSGFAIWKISDPATASLNFDFVEPEMTMQTIGGNLKDVVESAIRHQVANMTLEDVLRKRGSIILQLKRELAYVAGQWGLTIETIEIKNVQIMSEQLFANMQAKFRDEVRLMSETSGLETDRQIAERKYAQKELLALKDQEFKRREAERKAELERINARMAAEFEAEGLTQQTAFKAKQFAAELELAGMREVNREKQLRIEERLNNVEREVQEAQFALQSSRREHENSLDEIQDAITRRGIETANRADPLLAFITQMPEALASFAPNQLNIGDDTLLRMGSRLIGLLRKSENSSVPVPRDQT